MSGLSDMLRLAMAPDEDREDIILNMCPNDLARLLHECHGNIA